MFDSLVVFSTANEFSDSTVSILESKKEFEKFGKPQSQQINVRRRLREYYTWDLQRLNTSSYDGNGPFAG